MADAHTKPYPSVLVLLCWPAPVQGGIRPIEGPFHPSIGRFDQDSITNFKISTHDAVSVADSGNQARYIVL